MKVSAKSLAIILNGTCEGNPDVEVWKPCKIEEGEIGGISFLANSKYESYLYNTQCSAIIVSEDFVPSQPYSPTLIRVKDVYGAVATLLSQFNVSPSTDHHISSLAFIDKNAVLPTQCTIEAFSCVSQNASIGENTRIYPHVFVGENVKVGRNVIIHAGVKIYHDCIIGDNVIIHSNVVIGSDGFGFTKNEKGEYIKINQIGNVIIEDNVEIGANTVIDRATMGSTFIRKGVKLDNLIQIAHNVEINENTVIAAQAGVAGSSKIGKDCLIGGQVGIVGHIQIADGTMIQAQSGVNASIKETKTKWYGSPALDYTAFLRSFSIFKKLPELLKRLEKLEADTRK